MRKLILSTAVALATLFLFSFATLAAGTTANLSWTPPTQYVDGTAVGANDIASYTITWSHTAGGPVVGTKTVAAPATSTTVTGLICGQDFFVITATTTASAVYPNVTSDPSNPATFPTGIVCKINPPTGVTAS